MVTGCGCHEPAVFGHVECSLATLRRPGASWLVRQEQAEYAQLERRIEELRQAEEKSLKQGVGAALHSLRKRMLGLAE